MAKTHLKKILLALTMLIGTFSMSAQNSFPAPGGGGGNSVPSPGAGSMMRPSAPMWGNPWNNAWNSPVPPGVPPVNSPVWQNSGTTSVIGCGYDAQGVWRTVPMSVSYNYNGVQYNVTVLNAWNPWFNQWDYNVDVPAVNTYYLLRGVYYRFYAVLSTGTFYFNL